MIFVGIPVSSWHDTPTMRGVKARAAGALCGVALGFAVASADEEWPRFRGSNGGVAADHPSLPDQWGPAQNIVWKIDVPGRSWSSPVIWGDHVFVTTAINTLETESLLPVASYVSRSNGGTMTFMDVSKPSAPHRWVLYDVDLKTGRIRWERVAHTGVPAKSRHVKNSYAAETPVTDGERVYVYFGDVGLFAFDMDGKPLWSRPMDALEMQTGFGHAASPVVDDSRVYIVNDNEEQSFIAAYDKRTGAQVWRVDRKEASNWTTPLVWKNELRTEIVTAATGGVRSYNVNGRLLWQFTGMSTFAVPSPLASGGLLYVMSGYTASPLRPAYAIRPGATGDISLKPDRDEQRVHRLGRSHAGDVPSVSARVSRLLLHPPRSRLPDVQRSGDREADLSAAAHQQRHRHVHRVAVGIQREGVCTQRGRRHVRVSVGSRIQSARQELVERDGAGDASGCRWKPDHPHSVEALSDQQVVLIGRA